MGTPSSVYLVEDHTNTEPADHTRYWINVYLSEARAKAAVEHYAEAGGHGSVLWINHGGSSDAYTADMERRHLYRVVTLAVHDDSPIS